MTAVCSVYSQLLQLFPRAQFAQAVKQHQAEFNAKGAPPRSTSPAAPSARPHMQDGPRAFLFMVSHGGKGPPLRALDSPRCLEVMKTRTGSASLQFRPCVWCGQPVGRLNLSVTGPAEEPGVPHRWVFCGPSCLLGWVASEWG
jgi:hypothetical protein